MRHDRNLWNLTQSIMEAIRRAAKPLVEERPGNTAWTAGLLDSVADLTNPSNVANANRALFAGLSVYANGIIQGDNGERKRGDRGGEWLFDLCMLEWNEHGYLARMPLALECEWGNDDAILDDFQKLIVCRADLRVMIFGEANQTTPGTFTMLRR